MTRQHPGGVRRIENANARPPHPEEGVTAGGIAQSICWRWFRVCAGFGSEFLQDLVQDFCKGLAEDFPAGGISQGVAQDFLHGFCRGFCNRFSRKISPESLQKPSGRVPGASPGPPRTIPERLQTGSQNNFKTLTPKVLCILCASSRKLSLLGSFWDPAGAQKSIKDRLFPEK